MTIVSRWFTGLALGFLAAVLPQPVEGQTSGMRLSDGQTSVRRAPAPSPQAAQRPPARPSIRATSLRLPQGQHRTPSFVPRHEQAIGSAVVLDEGSALSAFDDFEDDIIYEEGAVLQGHSAVLQGHSASCHDCGTVSSASCHHCGICVQCCWFPCPLLYLENLEFSGGVHGVTGPRNFAPADTRNGTGSFGFHEGLNWGAPFPTLGHVMGLGLQLGFQAVHSNFSGAQFTDDSRNQIFVTGGAFRRLDHGFQGGVVFDYMYDDWYSIINATQLRGELSWVYPAAHELGFWFAAGTNTTSGRARLQTGPGQFTEIEERWEGMDLYAFFYRYRDDCFGANGRLFAGFTGHSDGLIGADIELPLWENVSLRSEFTYLIPDGSGSGNSAGPQDEAWNVGLSMVWRPWARAGHVGYFRPLFNVADNGSFIVRRRPE